MEKYVGFITQDLRAGVANYIRLPCTYSLCLSTGYVDRNRCCTSQQRKDM